MKRQGSKIKNIIGNFNSRQKGESPELKTDLLILTHTRRKNEKVKERVPVQEGNMGHSGSHPPRTC